MKQEVPSANPKLDAMGELIKTIHDLNEKNSILEARLTKAVDIIEGLMRFCRCFAQHHTEDIRYKEAEQFLQEVEGGN